MNVIKIVFTKNIDFDISVLKSITLCYPKACYWSFVENAKVSWNVCIKDTETISLEENANLITIHSIELAIFQYRNLRELKHIVTLSAVFPSTVLVYMYSICFQYDLWFRPSCNLTDDLFLLSYWWSLLDAYSLPFRTLWMCGLALSTEVCSLGRKPRQRK